ncbi:MAG: hypothetical protein BJ554DRAFT_2088, partial [Olpidium bornovanus]
MSLVRFPRPLAAKEHLLVWLRQRRRQRGHREDLSEAPRPDRSMLCLLVVQVRRGKVEAVHSAGSRLERAPDPLQLHARIV